MKADFEFSLEDFRKIPRRLAERAERGIKRLAQRILNESHKRVPKVTENLYNSGTVNVQGGGLDTEATVRYTARYAAFVERGTGLFGPHKKRIYPKNKQGLFNYKAKGYDGQKPQPYLKPAFDESVPLLADYVFGER